MQFSCGNLRAVQNLCSAVLAPALPRRGQDGGDYPLGWRVH